MKTINKIKTTTINNIEVKYQLIISKHCVQQREYKSNKFEDRLLDGFDIEKIDTALQPHFKQLFKVPTKYLFIINKTIFDNEKICLVVAVDKDKSNDDLYYITVVTSIHRDTDSILFKKIDTNNRIYANTTYEKLLEIKSCSTTKNILPKEKVYVSKKLGLKIVKKVNKRDKYFQYKNISQLPIKNTTQKELIKFLKAA